MTTGMTEWEFTGDAKSWLDQAIQQDPPLPFKEAKVEQRGSGSNQRRDLSLLGKDGRVLITGEVKLPYRKDGSSPYLQPVVADARSKARKAGARFFFTWNVNECVLWETEAPDAAMHTQNYRRWQVTPEGSQVLREEHMLLPTTVDKIRYWIPEFLRDLARCLNAAEPFERRTPDQRFIEALESALELPIRFTFEELASRFVKQGPFRADLERWMRDDQGWVLSLDPNDIRENLLRAAKVACYSLVNRLVFYEALLKRHKKMRKCEVPDHLAQGDALRLHLESFFATAKNVTGDYETVFGEDHSGIGFRIPFYSDLAVGYWRDLIVQIHAFDFSKLDYEIIGSIFERLIAPEERHKYGQFYTRAEVVDLINSFCIREGSELVMDPACGGGTFLVRAYARKRELAPERQHAELLSDLFGADIAAFATNLTTINLATRDLIDDANYPQVARADFFDVLPRKMFIKLPNAVAKAAGLGKSQMREVQIPLLDAVVGNPPYIRQEMIRAERKAYYRDLTGGESGIKLSGRSDIHCYFWPHSAEFLKADGYLCFLTSSQWLDVEYGFKLQGWVLQNFKIVAIIESVDEPWFVGARVTTAITILQKCDDEAQRLANRVRFVQLRQPIGDLVAHDGTTAGAMQAADRLRDEFMQCTESVSNARFRLRVIDQKHLWDEGVRLGRIMRRSGEAGAETDADDEDAPPVSGGSYFGGKWGVYVRAPDLWFEWIKRFGSKFASLGELATIRRGITTGNDKYFFLVDSTTACLERISDQSQFEDEFGVQRKLVRDGKVKLVLAGEARGQMWPVESKYLEPEVHSLMEVKGHVVRPEDCKRMILLCGERKAALKGTFVLKYIQWCERHNVHKGSTIAARANKNREWYDLTGHPRGIAFWPKSQQYKHAVPLNLAELQANCNLYDILPGEKTSETIVAVLNSTLAVLAKFQYGRPVGNEGNLKTEIVDVNMMPVPDVRNVSKAIAEKLTNAFSELRKRDAMQFLSERRMREMAFERSGKDAELKTLSDKGELDMPDRKALDHAVLELLGVSNKNEREKMLGELYAYLKSFFEVTRRKEERAISNKNTSKRRGAASPQELAQQVFDELRNRAPQLLRRYEPDFLTHEMLFDAHDVPAEGEASIRQDLISGSPVVEFMKGKRQTGLCVVPTSCQAQMLKLLADNGMRGIVRIAHVEEECQSVRDRYTVFVRQRDQMIATLIGELVSDDDLAGKVREFALSMILRDH